MYKCQTFGIVQRCALLLGEEEEDDPDFDPSKVKGGENPQECKQQ